MKSWLGNGKARTQPESNDGLATEAGDEQALNAANESAGGVTEKNAEENAEGTEERRRKRKHRHKSKSSKSKSSKSADNLDDQAVAIAAAAAIHPPAEDATQAGYSHELLGEYQRNGPRNVEQDVLRFLGGVGLGGMDGVGESVDAVEPEVHEYVEDNGASSKKSRHRKKKSHRVAPPTLVDPELASLDNAAAEAAASSEQHDHEQYLDSSVGVENVMRFDIPQSSQEQEKFDIPQASPEQQKEKHDFDLENKRLSRGISAQAQRASAAAAAAATTAASEKIIDPSDNIFKRRKKGDLVDTSKRAAWCGDGSELAGTFSPDETAELDRFMNEYSKEHCLTLAELCMRVWSTDRKRDAFWDGISSALPHRTRASIYKHVRRQYHIFHQRGKWTKEEDDELGQLVQERGSQWKQIGMILHRMPEDCRDRWRNYVKCGDQRAQNKWNPSEEAQLREIIVDMWNSNVHTINWTLVSERMGGRRSRIQCRYKWNKLKKKYAELAGIGERYVEFNE